MPHGNMPDPTTPADMHEDTMTLDRCSLQLRRFPPIYVIMILDCRCLLLLLCMATACGCCSWMLSCDTYTYTQKAPAPRPLVRQGTLCPNARRDAEVSQGMCRMGP